MSHGARQVSLLMPYGVRDLLRILAAGDYPEDVPPREVMLQVRRRGWATGKQQDRTLAITEDGRRALERDNAARSRIHAKATEVR